MTTHCPRIVNAIIDQKNDYYLELGINDASNYNDIRASRKCSVDINGSPQPTFHGTTDDFFKVNKEMFDITFIDANHDYDFVVRDLCNSSKVTKKLIIMHDMNPPNEVYTGSGHCSDSYKLLTLLKKETDIEIFTLDSDFGLSFVPITEKSKNIVLSDKLIEQYRTLSYADFVAYRDKNIKLYTTEEMIDKLKELISVY